MKSIVEGTSLKPGGVNCIGPLLVVMAALLVTFQYTTLEKFACLPPGVGLLSVSEWVASIHGRVLLTWTDTIVPMAMSVVCLSLIALELKGRVSAQAG